MKNPALVGGLTGLALAYVVGTALGIGHQDIGPVVFAGLVIGAIIAETMQRGLRGASSGFWHSLPGRWLIGRIAGLAVILLLVFPSFYAASVVTGLLLLAVLAVAGADIVMAMVKYLGAATDLTAIIILWALFVPTKVFIGKKSAPLRRVYRSLRFGNGGSSTFAGICEEWANLWTPGKLFMGYSLYDRHWPVGIKDERMVTVLGANGAGKDATVIIPNLLGYTNGSAFVNDIKGQAAAVTARAREEAGQKVYIMDAFDMLKNGTARLNPLDGLDPNSGTYVEDIYSIVDALVIESGNEHNRFFVESARTVIAGAIDYIVRRHHEEFAEEDMEEEAAE